MTDLFIFTGEASGDLHGEKILEALYAQNPNLKISGVAGPKMRAVGIDCVMPMEKFQVMGFVDVFFALPRLIRQFYQVANCILKLKPKAVLFIDYPGFNIRLARHLRKKGYHGKLCHYICPSVWAWGKGRIPKMAKTLDLLLTLFPFEAKYFAHTPLSITHVGHPLVQRLQETTYQPIPIPEGKTLVGIFPGSRTKEIERNLPMILKVTKKLLANHLHLFFAVSAKFPKKIQAYIDQEGLTDQFVLIPPERTYDLMYSSSFAIAKSGTVTLELALHGVPTVVTYAISPLDLFIARDLLRVRLPHYCIVNIVAGKTVFPELFGPHFSEKSLHEAFENILVHRENYVKELGAFKAILDKKEASTQAARALIKLLSKKKSPTSAGVKK